MKQSKYLDFIFGYDCPNYKQQVVYVVFVQHQMTHKR